MGDAVMAIPAARAIRKRFPAGRVTAVSNAANRKILQPCDYIDDWIEQHGFFQILGEIRRRHFQTAVLFKNSFFPALITAMANVAVRVGYCRYGRSLLLTEKLHAPKLPDGKYQPRPMIDYYLALAGRLGAETNDRKIELNVDAQSKRQVLQKFPRLGNKTSPCVILVPGGAFGSSKRWPAERFAQTADWLTDKFSANVFLSVAPNRDELATAEKICADAKHPPVNLGIEKIGLDKLKALFSLAELVITNDTGPRHIAGALGIKTITLFGPNDPLWTDCGYTNEVQIVADVPCAPCARPKCNQPEHYCMNSITIEKVCQTAAKLMEK